MDNIDQLSKKVDEVSDEMDYYMKNSDLDKANVCLQQITHLEKEIHEV